MVVESGSSGANKGSYSGDRGDPSKLMNLLSASTAVLPYGPCRALWSVSSAMISCADHAGTTHDNFPIPAFEAPIGISILFSVTGSTAIWALY